MTPFLQQVATAFYQRYGQDVQSFAFVFPNRRAGLFFRKYLAQAAGKPLFAPAILTISELFFQLSDKQPVDRIRMLFLLYKIYIRQSGWEESFDDFVFWGEMLLGDFDDVDKYLVDARRLFANVTDLLDLEKDLAYLSEAQIAAIRSFWSSFSVGQEGANQQQFIKIWQLLYSIYNELRNTLAAEGAGYEGMIFREVVEKTGDERRLALPYRKVVFVGLNALSAAEKQLLTLLHEQGIADFYWDYASPMVTDPDNRASFFSADHLSRFPSELSLPKETLAVPEIELIAVPSRIGQAKQLYPLLKEMLAGRTALDLDEALRTAVILPDEQLLIPVLNSIPEEITRINVTLGYPLKGTPIAALMENILALRSNIRTADDGTTLFYHRETLAVLNHPYLLAGCPDETVFLANDIALNNKIFIPADELRRTPLLALIFAPIDDADALSAYLVDVLQELNRTLSALHPDKDEDDPVAMNDLEQEFIFHYFTTVNRMRDMIAETGIRMSVQTCFSLLKRVADAITIPFHGEPLSGLQVMGVLETRVLDFDRLIILSMNEGLFPAKKQTNTFIPYNLRRGFGLPAYEHQDSIWAYHFYRLITRASRITLLFDTRNDTSQSGEASRFVHQLRYHYGLNIKDKQIVYNIASSHAPEIKIQKTDAILRRLDAYLDDGDRALSASAINPCLDCPLKFYLSAIEGLREEDEVSENIENSLFGSILHRTLEHLYQPLEGAQITADLLRLLAAPVTLTRAIEHAFAELFFHSPDIRPLSGRNYLTGEMIRKYALKVLDSDRRLTPFRYLQSECRLHARFPLADGRSVRLKGFIDRLDEVAGQRRIVDYKTGIRKPLECTAIDTLFDPADPHRQPAIMQVFTYAWMYGQTNPAVPVQPVVYYMRSLFAGDFDPAIYLGKEKAPVTDFTPFRAAYEDALRRCLDTLFSPDVPFLQATGNKPCAYCPFVGLCGR
jgi:hypothetical protein